MSSTSWWKLEKMSISKLEQNREQAESKNPVEEEVSVGNDQGMLNPHRTVDI